MCWCRVTLPHFCMDFYNLMSFWTMTPRNIFQSTGLLSIKVMLYIKKRKKKKKGLSQNMVSCWTVEWRERWLPLSSTRDFLLACGSLLLGSKYLHCVWGKGQFPMNACSVTVACLSPLSPVPGFRFLGPPQSSTTEPEARSSGGTSSTDTAFFPPRKWVRVYQKPMTNAFFFF